MSFIKFTPPAVDVYKLPAIDLFSRELSKYASRNYLPPKIEEYLKTAEPIEGGRIVLVHGLGSDEVWGINNNGDGFPEYMINDDGVKEATLINDDPANDWGYITFQKYAHSFADHVNNHPNNTIGGKVILADWNPEMHRVEIVMPIVPKATKTAAARHKAEEAVHKIDQGEPIDVSMGCKVAYDVCKRCKNKAKNRSEYCDHAKHAMGQVMSDGVRIGVDNPRPKFFDISYVKRGADRAAKLLMKVASTTTVVRVPDWPDHRKKAGRKVSAIKKQVPMSGVDPISALADRTEVDILKNVVPYDMSTSEKLPAKVARLFSVYPAADVISTLTAAGVVLLPHELPEKVASERFYTKEPAASILSDIDIQDLMVKRSMYTPFLVMRLTRKGLISGSGSKVASNVAADSAAMTRYGKYVNFLKTAFQTESQVESWNKMVTASHRIVETLTAESNKVVGLWKDAGFPALDDDMKSMLGTEWSQASSVVKVALSQGWMDLGNKIKGGVAGLAGQAKGLGSKALSAAKPAADVGAHALGVGGGPYPASALLAYGGAPLVMSSFFADKMNKGEDPGAVGQFVAKHPLMSSGASVLGSLWLHRMANKYR